MHLIRFLSSALAALTLCQCTSVTRSLAPLIDRNGEKVFLTLKSGASPAQYKESAFMAAMEKTAETKNHGQASERLEEKYFPKESADAKVKGEPVGFVTVLVCGPSGTVTTKSGETLVAKIPLIAMESVGIPQSSVDSMIPELQRHFAESVSKQFRMVPLSSLVTKTAASGTKFLE